MRVESFVTERGQVRGVIAKDALTGGTHTVSARLVINATALDRPHPGDAQAASAGHAPDEGLPHRRPARPPPHRGDRHALDGERGNGFLFAIPSGESVFIGTTDTDFSGDYDRVRVTGAEVEHFPEHVNASFPGVEITADDVVPAGLRPLLR